MSNEPIHGCCTVVSLSCVVVRSGQTVTGHPAVAVLILSIVCGSACAYKSFSW